MQRAAAALFLAMTVALAGCAVGPDGVYVGNACCVVQTGGGRNGPVNSVASAPPGFFVQPNGHG